MKTSNKWVLAALVLLFGALAAYNIGLRAEYRTGAYKDPLRNTKALDFKNFTEVNVQAASAMDVKIVAGPYGVRLNNEAADYVRVSQHGSRLTIALVYPNKFQYLGRGNTVTITCPQLKRLQAGAVYSAEGKPVTDKQTDSWAGHAVLVQGFVADSLALRQDYATRIELANNRLRYLRAEIGSNSGSRSVLHIARDNRIQTADLAVKHQSELVLDGKIEQPHYFFGESARAALAGTALAELVR